MGTKYLLVSGDTLSKLQVTCENDVDSTAIDLTGHTVDLQWHNAAGVLVTKLMTNDDPVNGIASYQFASAELISDQMSFQVRITNTSSGKLMHNITLLNVPVRKVLA